MSDTDATSRFNYLQLPLAQMEAINTRFEEQVKEAQRLGPPSKELIRKSVRRQGDRCPIWLRRTCYDIVLRYGEDLVSLYREFPDDLVRFAPYDVFLGPQDPDKIPINPLQVQVQAENAEWTDEWGVLWGHLRGGIGAFQKDNPLKDWSQLDEYLAKVMPKARAFGRLEPVRAQAKEFSANHYSFGLFCSALYQFISLRGMENAFTDFYDHEPELRRLIDASTEYSLDLVRYWAELGVDSILILDDWGTQNSLMFSPATWRSFLKEPYRQIFAEAHRCGLDVLLHTCGNVIEIIEDFIEIGLDVLDPLQPSAMNLEEVAQRFGGRISFCGTIDVQQLLTQGTPQQVKDTIRRNIDLLGKQFGNGLILAPANALTPDIPFENLRAMFEACHAQ
jgi:uroporphyrinogen decarboxylase